ncbi:MAG: AmmeMemoRadiSam system protein B [Desulfatiglans sp.]|nr:AmmeMemoRadiSam system protein B [Thermodesulfobacteriota bacterium]MEE4352028.1 AmmeMemoRadiSam system protein B [Desulfatiglans sp.]
MKEIRRSDFAGSWYPGNKGDVERAIEEFSHAAGSCPCDEGKVVGGIVPHAGWYFSGNIALNVIKCLALSGMPETCLIFGRHLHPGSRNYIMKDGSWDTPLGPLKIDSELAAEVEKEFSFTVETASACEPDNTIELQLPFIKYFFPSIDILPIGISPVSKSLEIARRVVQISKRMDRKMIVIGSTDLTHYGVNYGYSPMGTGKSAVEWVKNKNDKRVIDLILDMDAMGVISESLANQNACCSGAAGAAIEAAKELGAEKAFQIKYSTSYDVRPDNSFVGYVGIVFCL